MINLPARLSILLLATALPLLADGIADNDISKTRRQPPPGKPLTEADRQELKKGVDELAGEIQSLGSELKGKPRLLDLMPDVQIFHKAVDWALANDEFFNPTNEVPAAREMLRQGLERARQLREGRSPWTTATGLVVRGYKSRLDDSIQPYGLVVPSTYQPSTAHQHRLDFWFHGRGETLTELAFLRDRQRSAGEFTPADAFVLHPYSRYCNGQKLAGEVDAFEALEHVEKHYPIDVNRRVVRGFSLGGAACWHMAVHHAGLWAAAAPGAGFSETPAFLKVFQNETLKPTWYEQKLWRLYDAPGYALNLVHCPTVAYSGEKDNQKQAADVMSKAMAEEGMNLVHVIGANAGHHYTPEAKAEINQRIDAIVAQGRQTVPRRVRLVTWTLKYNTMAWVTVDGLAQHWERASVDARIVSETRIEVQTRNVTQLTLNLPPGACPLDQARPVDVTLDGNKVRCATPGSDRSWAASFIRTGNQWKEVVATNEAAGLRKQHDLQGPIDDAFLGRFLMVKPTGQGWHPATVTWVGQESEHATTHWRRHFRGDARVKEDSAVTSDDIADSNLILWGDPSSNKVLAKLLGGLPIQWTRDSLQIGSQTFPASTHLPALIFPNPLNPRRYVVLNSGFTFREYDYLNNARQVPKLPDYAIFDITKPATSKLPAEVVTAGFFNEEWKFVKQ